MQGLATKFAAFTSRYRVIPRIGINEKCFLLYNSEATITIIPKMGSDDSSNTDDSWFNNGYDIASASLHSCEYRYAIALQAT